ncbi:putative nucleotidyltransferase substrate binding domain-containing protein [Streptomyces sp. NPDC048277]|uniref:putative nucleotidyltransferase substrate binding domain-containing protein n=1 Tax=Streptomyces sp. NPDC048277 TaxID=3155027 RepID=UPI0033CD7369
MREFVEFLGAQAPYDRLEPDDLERLAHEVEVEYFTTGEVIVASGSQGLDHIYVVRTGSVEVTSQGRVVDVLGQGDTFGHVSVLSGLPPALTVRAAEETLCYRLPDPRTVVRQPERLTYAHYGTLIARDRLIAAGGASDRLERPVGQFLRPVVWCRPEDTVRETAVRVTAAGQSCALMRLRDSFGIVTDDDFRRRVATGEVPLDAPVSAIASSPALTVTDDVSVSTAYLRMIEVGVHHVVVTGADGGVRGVARVIDMASAEVRHPLVVRSAIASARSLDELAEACKLLRPTVVELHDADVSATHLGAVLTAIVDAVLLKAVALHAQDRTLADLVASWMVLGSFARREPLPDSDIDTALSWRPRPSAAEPPGQDAVRSAADDVLGDLVRCGLRLCPNDANASHPLFNRTAASWRRTVSGWIRDPADPVHLLLVSAMLDSRAMTQRALGQAVPAQLLTGPGRQDLLKAMLRFALTERPPAGFVRGFVVEHFGERRGHLDLKRAGLRPVTSLARALALQAGDTSGSTPDRLGRAADAGLLTTGEADMLKGAFTLCYSLLVEEEVTALRAGRAPETFIASAQLDPLQRRHLRNAFRAITQVQDRISAGLPGLA